MTNPRWNEEELKCYERLAKAGNGKDPEGIEGLAYTAVNEMYLSRIDRENKEKFCEEVTDAIDMMATGICMLEDRLGFSIRKMADRRRVRGNDDGSWPDGRPCRNVQDDQGRVTRGFYRQNVRCDRSRLGARRLLCGGRKCQGLRRSSLFM